MSRDQGRDLPYMRVLDVRMGGHGSPIVAAIEFEREGGEHERMLVRLGVKEISLERDLSTHACVLTFPVGVRKIPEAIERELKRF